MLRSTSELKVICTLVIILDLRRHPILISLRCRKVQNRVELAEDWEWRKQTSGRWRVSVGASSTWQREPPEIRQIKFGKYTNIKDCERIANKIRLAYSSRFACWGVRRIERSLARRHRVKCGFLWAPPIHLKYIVKRQSLSSRLVHTYYSE